MYAPRHFGIATGINLSTDLVKSVHYISLDVCGGTEIHIDL